MLEAAIAVLIIEDEPLIAMDLEAELEENGVACVVASNPDAVMAATAQNKFMCAIVDFNLGGHPTLQYAQSLHAAGAKICFVSGSDISNEVLTSLNAPLFSKPIDMQAVMRHVLDALKRP